LNQSSGIQHHTQWDHVNYMDTVLSPNILTRKCPCALSLHYF